MANIKILKFLIAIENIFCVYRNYDSLNNFWKKLAVVRVVFLIILYASVCVASYFITYAGTDLLTTAFISSYTLLTTINSTIPIIIAIKQTRCFEILIDNIEKTNKYCSEEATYEKKLNKLKKQVLIFVVFLIVCYIISFFINTLIWMYMLRDSSIFFSYIVIQSLLSFWREVRFQFEFIVFNIIMKIINMSLKQLNINLFKLLEILKSSRDGIDKATGFRIRRELKNWTSAYNCLALCTDGLNQCFGIQIFFSLFILTVYFIGLSYNWVATLRSKAQGNGLGIILVVNYTVAIIYMLFTGQCTQNEGDALKKSMSKIYIALQSVPDSNVKDLLKLVKDLNRQIRVQPIKIQILSTTTVGMGLFLGIVSTAVSYTIVLLQFSHVV